MIISGQIILFIMRTALAYHAELTGKVDATNKELAEVSKVVHRTDSKLNVLFWVIGVLIAAATFLITVGGAAGWFK